MKKIIIIILILSFANINHAQLNENPNNIFSIENTLWGLLFLPLVDIGFYNEEIYFSLLWLDISECKKFPYFLSFYADLPVSFFVCALPPFIGFFGVCIPSIGVGFVVGLPIIFSPILKDIDPLVGHPYIHCPID